jgi:hypothetical protein
LEDPTPPVNEPQTVLTTIVHSPTKNFDDRTLVGESLPKNGAYLSLAASTNVRRSGRFQGYIAPNSMVGLGARAKWGLNRNRMWFVTARRRVGHESQRVNHADALDAVY